MMQWYYTIGAQAYGPVSNEVIRDLANRGVLGPNSNVLPQGAASWTSLRVHEAAIGLVRNRGGDYTGTQLLTAAYSSSPPPPPPPPGYQQYRGSISSARLGSWWARAAALGLDGVIVGVPLNILVTVLGLRRFELTKYNKFDGTSGLHVHWGGVSLAILFGGMFIFDV